MAKIYTKTTWTDEVPETTPVKYKIENDETTLDEVTISVVTPVTTGTAVNAANLNKIEEGIDALDSLVDALFTETVYVRAIRDTATLLSGDGLMTFMIPAALNTYQISDIQVSIYVPSSSGAVRVQVHNLRSSADILSIEATIDEGEYSSYTAAVAPVVNPSAAGVETGDRLRVDIDAAGIGAKGLDLIITLERT